MTASSTLLPTWTWISRASTFRVSVYPDRAGVRWWTKAWFNGKEEGEPSVEIEERMAVQFIHCQVDKDAWLEEHYPKQMEIYHNAIEQTKEQILQQYNI